MSGFTNLLSLSYKTGKTKIYNTMNTDAIKDFVADHVLLVMAGFFGMMFLGMYLERRKQEKIQP